jgi:1,2-phenylacetyl-CoA epoxidase catalytic subunit
MIPSPQGEIGKANGESLDEHSIREMEKRLAVCVKIASNGIARGNELALTAEETALYAEDVRSKLADTDDERIAREVAKRARGNLTLFELPTGPEEIGGQHNVPTYFPARQNLTLRSCQVVSWAGTIPRDYFVACAG